MDRGKAVGSVRHSGVEVNHALPEPRRPLPCTLHRSCTAQSPARSKPLTVSFDAGRLSSDGGLAVLRETEARLGLAGMIARPLRETRDPARIRHTYAWIAAAGIAAARMLIIAAGYEDCDGADVLRRDPALKIAVGRWPENGAGLTSLPPRPERPAGHGSRSGPWRPRA